MRKFGNNGTSNKNGRTLLVGFSLVILVFTSVQLVKELINKRELQNNIGELSVKVNELKQRNSDLSSMITYFQSLDFVEQEARTKLNFRKPGEKIIIVAGSMEDGNGQVVNEGEINLNTEENSIVNKKTNPQKWWDYFFADN